MPGLLTESANQVKLEVDVIMAVIIVSTCLGDGWLIVGGNKIKTKLSPWLELGLSFAIKCYDDINHCLDNCLYKCYDINQFLAQICTLLDYLILTLLIVFHSQATRSTHLQDSSA